MALVLVGLSSYAVTVVDEDGNNKRVSIRRGQDVSGLNIPEDRLTQLKAMTVRGPGRRLMKVFAEVESAFDAERHSAGGKISGPSMRAATEAPAPVEEPKVEEVVVEEAPAEEPKVEEAPAEEPKVEEAAPEAPKAVEPEKKTPAKKTPAKKTKK